MPTPPAASRGPTIRLSLRLDLADGSRIGPGQIRLLELIAEAGSLRAAAEALDMSYPKALKLTKTLNQIVGGGAVVLAHGGSGGGGATLTENGALLVTQYRQLEADARTRHKSAFQALEALIGDQG